MEPAPSFITGESSPVPSGVRDALQKEGYKDLLLIRIVEFLVEDKGYKLEDLLPIAAGATDGNAGDIFVSRQLLAPSERLRIEAELSNMQPVQLASVEVEGEMARSLIRSEQAVEWNALPYSRDDIGRLIVALGDTDPRVRDEISQALPRETILFHLADRDEVATWVQRVFDPSAAGALQKLGEAGEATERQFIVREEALDSRIIRLVDAIIDQAREARASDIHIEPRDGQTWVRFRIDGVMRFAMDISPADTPSISARIKTMAQMRVDEHRMPQDGRATTRTGPKGVPLDLRVVTAPTIYGESIAIRLLDPAQAILSLEQLGMSETNLQRYLKGISAPHGICLVTGPTGSGKSTTLYSSLNRVITDEKKLISIEDPVEYRLGGITQIDVSGDTRSGEQKLDFALALRAILRADPDIIMVGEIRDLETAQIAVDAALTGHFLYSTLHTNSALASVVRLGQIGVDRFLLAEGLEVIVAQRLIRRLCSCRVPQQIDETTLQALQAPSWALGELQKTIYAANPQGCASCGGQGYFGRIGVHEVVLMNDDLRQAIMAGAPIEELESIARKAGMAGLREDALQKAWTGITSLEEVGRVTT